jgi:hypothetical protein
VSPRDFAANVHSGLFVGWVHHIVALVAERPIDKGRIMICTYRLRDHLGTHPVATIMMRDMVRRLASPGRGETGASIAARRVAESGDGAGARTDAAGAPSSR